uniref:Uncharacterized protein n=1 Tax=Arundo donax TaxID=35708 RepID=A0A0A9FUW3_ARUDO
MHSVGSTIQNACKATIYGSAWTSISLAASSPTCNILSNKRLHINSQRFRSDTTMDELMPVALVD